ncbi:MAG: hypothetical protein KatS3mg082_1422 [Nitrospiraceae bacterium]|nr:MAG: hypothetical protein KatS3mg082_1422 [Nitrospiraceae bacterium]
MAEVGQYVAALAILVLLITTPVYFEAGRRYTALKVNALYGGGWLLFFGGLLLMAVAG